MVQNQYIFKNTHSESSASYHFSLSVHIWKPTPISKPLIFISSIYFFKNFMYIIKIYIFYFLQKMKMVTDSRCSS